MSKICQNVDDNAVISTTILQKQVLLLSTCLEKEYDAEIWLIVQYYDAKISKNSYLVD